jgi:uncharacterized protein YbaR (Trm112 family)
MNRRMLDILVCPFDKYSTLELYEFNTRNIEKNNGNLIIEPKPQNIKLEESIENKSENSLKDIPPDDNIIIEEGVLFCNTCNRFYPIVEEIPIILPDELRDKDKDIEMLKKWSDSLPDKIIKEALPWHL